MTNFALESRADGGRCAELMDVARGSGLDWSRTGSDRKENAGKDYPAEAVSDITGLSSEDVARLLPLSEWQADSAAKETDS